MAAGDRDREKLRSGIRWDKLRKMKMDEEELENEAEGWLNKWELCNKCENNVDCISNFSYCKKVVLQSYLASAEPREKRIEELEAQIEKMKCCENCAFFKEKTYDICHRIKKLGTRKCAFYKMM